MHSFSWPSHCENRPAVKLRGPHIHLNMEYPVKLFYFSLWWEKYATFRRCHFEEQIHRRLQNKAIKFPFLCYGLFLPCRPGSQLCLESLFSEHTQAVVCQLNTKAKITNWPYLQGRGSKPLWRFLQSSIYNRKWRSVIEYKPFYWFHIYPGTKHFPDVHGMKHTGYSHFYKTTDHILWLILVGYNCLLGWYIHQILF